MYPCPEEFESGEFGRCPWLSGDECGVGNARDWILSHVAGGNGYRLISLDVREMSFWIQELSAAISDFKKCGIKPEESVDAYFASGTLHKTAGALRDDDHLFAHSLSFPS